MKNTKIILGLFSIALSLNLFAFVDKHDFQAETWSEGKSCLICHSLNNNLPKLSPPGSRVIDILKLSPEEKTAYESNSNNVTCLVCHQAQHSTIPIQNNSGTITLPSIKVPPVFTSGSEGSVVIRVLNNGTNMLDCLQCHDLHNQDSAKMLKVGY